MKYLVGVYGTLRQGFGLNRVLGDSQFLGELTTVIPYTMVDLGAFPGLVPSIKENFITFELYVVDEETLAHLDMVEGVPTLYDRDVIEVDGDPMYFYVYQGDASDDHVIECGDFTQYRLESTPY